MIDQFRDRRTLAMIFVVPLFLYPLMGVTFFQASQFVRERSSRILVIYSDEKPDFLPESKLLDYRYEKQPKSSAGDFAKLSLTEKTCDSVLVIPLGFQEEKPEPPLLIIYNTAVEKSGLAQKRLENAIEKWSQSLGEKMLEDKGIDIRSVSPIETQTQDIAKDTGFQGAAFWSKTLPVMLLLWALAGAFYPAVDLCAGEKERGTLETLLCSPATRGEIVLSKLCTVMSFSMLIAILNITCLAITGAFLISQLPMEVSLPLSSSLLMVIPLVPASLIFSSLCLALASYAKSSKEGQYYLLPLIMTVMPLIFIAVAPGSELTLGTALLPITGISLILRELLEGNYETVIKFMPVVFVVTILCCYFSFRFAIRQFNSESVLFNDSKKFDVSQWFTQLLKNRTARPTFAAGVMLAVVILTLKYFANFMFPAPQTFADVATSTLVLQLGIVLLPTLIFAYVFTRDPWGTLGFSVPKGKAVSIFVYTIAAIAAAILIFPVNVFFGELIQRLYPVSDAVLAQVEPIIKLFKSGPLPLTIGLMAVLPGVCEEVAFRGFILNGLLSTGDTKPREPNLDETFTAIVLSSFFFGIAHGMLQQSICVGFIGCMIGVIAVKSRSIWPCIAFHITNNALASLLT